MFVRLDKRDDVFDRSFGGPAIIFHYLVRSGTKHSPSFGVSE